MIEQLYTSAIRSSDLTLRPERLGHVDVILAFGMSRSRLGLAALRLHSEWDGSEIREGRPAGPIERAALRSWQAVHAGLQHWLAQIGVPDASDCACRTMEHWLNRNCPHCKGAGEVLKDGALRTCPKCKGVKLRREPHDPILRKGLNFLDDCCASARGSARKRLWGNH